MFTLIQTAVNFWRHPAALKHIYQSPGRILQRQYNWPVVVWCSAADPDPAWSGLFGSTGSGSGKIPDPDPGKYRIRYKTVTKLSKIQFRPNDFFIFDFKCHNKFLSLILSVIWCLDFVRSAIQKIFILLNIKNISKY